ncbi:hypothetical protein DMY24_21955 [Escherichia coli]|nr:hypothetical protein [Escherichia coli]EGE1508270.1 hypothetical protein [Escherichia coli]
MIFTYQDIIKWSEYKYLENGLINHKKSPDEKFTNLWFVILLKSKTSQPRYLWKEIRKKAPPPRHCSEKTSYFFVTFLIRKDRYYRICIY